MAKEFISGFPALFFVMALPLLVGTVVASALVWFYSSECALPQGMFITCCFWLALVTCAISVCGLFKNKVILFLSIVSWAASNGFYGLAVYALIENREKTPGCKPQWLMYLEWVPLVIGLFSTVGFSVIVGLMYCKIYVDDLKYRQSQKKQQTAENYVEKQ